MRHLVGAVAVDVHLHLAVHRGDQRLEPQVALGGAGGSAGSLVLCRSSCRRPASSASYFSHWRDSRRLDEGLPIAGDVAHARHRRLLALAVDALGVFAARHLQALRRARELHRLDGSPDVEQRHAAAADQVAGARRICIVVTPPASAREAGSCGHTECSAHTSAVSGSVISLPSSSRRGRAGVDAQVRVRVDEAGRDPAALRVDLVRVAPAINAGPTATILPSGSARRRRPAGDPCRRGPWRCG